MIIDLEDLPGQVFNHPFTGSVYCRDFKIALFFIAETTLETGLDAQIKILRAIRNTNAFRHRSTAWFEHTDNRVQTQWTISIPTAIAGRNADCGLADAISCPVLQIDDLLTEAAIMRAPAETFIAEGLWVDLNASLRFHSERRAWGAVKKARRHVDVAGIIARQEWRLFGLKFNRDPLRNKVLYRIGNRADLANAINLEDAAPHTAGCAAWQFNIALQGSGFADGKPYAEGFHTVRAVRDQRAIAIGNGAPSAVAHHGGDVDRFTWTVDATLGVKISVDFTGCYPSARVEFRQIDRRTREIKHGGIALQT